MSNNRLYIIDTETGEKHLLAKGWGSGWELQFTGSDDDGYSSKSLQKWLKDRDIASSGAPDIPTNLKLEIE